MFRTEGQVETFGLCELISTKLLTADAAIDFALTENNRVDVDYSSASISRVFGNSETQLYSLRHWYSDGTHVSLRVKNQTSNLFRLRYNVGRTNRPDRSDRKRLFSRVIVSTTFTNPSRATERRWPRQREILKTRSRIILRRVLKYTRRMNTKISRLLMDGFLIQPSPAEQKKAPVYVCMYIYIRIHNIYVCMMNVNIYMY